MEEMKCITPEQGKWIDDRYEVISSRTRRTLSANITTADLINTAKGVFIGDFHHSVQQQQWRAKVMSMLGQKGDIALFEGSQDFVLYAQQFFSETLLIECQSWDCARSLDQLRESFEALRGEVFGYFALTLLDTELRQAEADLQEGANLQLLDAARCLTRFLRKIGLSDDDLQAVELELIDRFMVRRNLSRAQAVRSIALEILADRMTDILKEARDLFVLTLPRRNAHLTDRFSESVHQVDAHNRVLVGAGILHLWSQSFGNPICGNVHIKQCIRALHTALRNRKFDSVILIPKAKTTLEPLFGKAQQTEISASEPKSGNTPPFPLPLKTEQWLKRAYNGGALWSELFDIVGPTLVGYYRAWACKIDFPKESQAAGSKG